MITLGIDPGTASTGFGVVRRSPGGNLEALAFGVIKTPAGTPMPERLLQLYRELTDLIALHRPDQGAVESLFFQKNVKTAMSVGQARGVALLVLAQAGLRLGEYTPLQVKQAVTGYGGADKSQVQHMVQALLGLASLPKPDDAADALAVAICHLTSSRIEEHLEGRP